MGATEPRVRFKYATALRNLGETDRRKNSSSCIRNNPGERDAAPSPTASQLKPTRSSRPESAKSSRRLSRSCWRPLLTTLSLPTSWRSLSIKHRRHRRGATALEQAVKIDPGFALAQNQLGYLDSRSGDPASAEEHFRAAVSAAPGYTQAWISLAATLGMESRFPKRRKPWPALSRLEPDNAEALQLRKDLTAAQEHAENTIQQHPRMNR